MGRENIEFLSGSESETVLFAQSLRKYLNPGTRILLEGDLGAGKTFLVKALLADLENSEVQSPTFSIVNEYHFANYNLYHFDFYRINHVEELYDLGFSEYYNDLDSIVIIEWWNLFSEIVFPPFIQIQIFLVDNDFRKIKVTFHE